MKILFIADLHFGHTNIIKYENRPFKSTIDMDAGLIKNWNNVVSKKDIVFLLGDLSFYPVEKTKNLVSLLNGRKNLILGNHDTKSPAVYMDMGFEFVSKYPIVYKEFFLLSHEPLYVNETMPYLNIHGHIHSAEYAGDKHFNVSVEKINYTPISFEEIQKKAGVK